MSPAAGVHVPLLPKSKASVKPASVSGAVFNVATSIIGAGIMSIPATLKVLGVIPTFLMILVIGLLAEVSVDFLMRFLPELNRHTSFFDLFTAVPVIVTAFTFHFNVHPIGFELAKPSDMVVAVRVALVLCGAIYFSIGLFGYLLFGDSTQSDILINFDQNTSGSSTGSLLNTLVRLSYAFHIILVFPLLNFSLRANVDELLFPEKPALATDNKRFVILTLVLIFFSYLMAIALPDIWYFFQFMGSTSAVCLAFIFPGSLALRDAHGISTRRDKITALIMIILAVVTSAVAISTNIYKFFGSKS
ncbi:hypothetical protein K1719_018153 [Acacia pycnantha]|nr:hypothetical protein K1719_018153 [Acacia pycnantha]